MLANALTQQRKTTTALRNARRSSVFGNALGNAAVGAIGTWQQNRADLRQAELDDGLSRASAKMQGQLDQQMADNTAQLADEATARMRDAGYQRSEQALADALTKGQAGIEKDFATNWSAMERAQAAAKAAARARVAAAREAQLLGGSRYSGLSGQDLDLALQASTEHYRDVASRAQSRANYRESQVMQQDRERRFGRVEVGPIPEPTLWETVNKYTPGAIAADLLKGTLGDLLVSVGFGETISNPYGPDYRVNPMTKDWMTPADVQSAQLMTLTGFIPVGRIEAAAATEMTVASRSLENAMAVMEQRLQRLGYNEANSTRILQSIGNGEQVVIVGENMKRVNAVARMVEGAGGTAVTYAPRNWTGVSRNALEANRSWIRYWGVEKNATVIDIGRQSTPRPFGPSPFYGIENRSLNKWDIYTPFP